MILSVAIAFAFLNLQEPNLFKVVPNPTGQNGYEEYVQAAIILAKPENKALVNYVRAATEAASQTGQAIVRPATIPEGLRALDLYRLEVKKLQPVIDLVHAGNLKPVSYPKAQITPVTLLPELAYFKLATRVFQHAAYVAFADGNSREGVSLIMDGLTFSEKFQVGDLIHLLVGRACTQMMYVAVDRHTPQIPLNGAIKLQTWATGADRRYRDAAIRAAKVERAKIRAFYDDFFISPSEYFEGMDIKPEDERQWTANLKAVSPLRRDQIYNSFFKRLELPMYALLERLNGPESTWLAPLEYDGFETNDTKPPIATDVAAPLLVLLRISKMLDVDGFEVEFPTQIARCTIQDRLFKIHCDATVFRWRTGKNPTKLADLYGADPTDPATGEHYDYSIRDNGWFKISCKHAKVGEVTISSRASQPSDDNEIPPPGADRTVRRRG
jgi:hypothetical protein